MSSVKMKDIKNEVTTLEKSIFDELNAVNVNDHTEEKNGLTYLSWAWAWSELKKRYPNAVYEIERFGEDKKPYLYDEDLGYMVFTKITIDGLTHEMWLPVMDSANKSMKNKPYQYKARQWNKQTKTFDIVDKTVQTATMFDINKTIMRCLVKNIGMFGLGIYIYAGEDLPEDIDKEQPQQVQETPKQTQKQQAVQKKEAPKQTPKTQTAKKKEAPKQTVQTKQEQNQMSLDEQIETKQNRLIELGVDFTNPNTIAFIDKYNYGQHEPSKMNDAMKTCYIIVLDEMIKIKEKQ